MSNDLQEIKKRILEDDGVRALLEAMECSYIEKKNNRYEAQLPLKFDSPNKRSVQVYLNDSLSSRIRTLGESDIDIYGLVSYIVHELYTEEERQKNLFKAKRWICDTLGYSDYTNQSYSPKPVMEHLKWLKDVKRQRKRKRELSDLENQIYDESILSQYIMYPHQKYLEEGINYETQLEFQVGYDLKSQRIIFPIHNRFGEIVSIKGRTIYEDYEQRDIYKFMYLYNFNKMIELFNFHRAAYYILEKKEIIIYEGEKTAMISSQWGYRNCVSISGDDLSEWQVKMIKEMGNDIQIVIAMDKDKSVESIKKQAAKFGKTRSVFALWDKDNLFADRDSPCDRGEAVFAELYNDYRFRVPT